MSLRWTGRLVTLWLLAACLLVAGQSRAQSVVFTVSPAISGGWFNPDHDGEGLTIEVLDGERAVVIWYTYDTQGNQVWILGVGQIDGDRIEVNDAHFTSGGVFGPTFDPADVVRHDWGRIELVFDGCDSALLEYQGPPAFGSGSLPLQRLTTVRSLECSDARRTRLGFTPFPPEVPGPGAETLIATYDKIEADADIVAHHFDDGVPWPEALAGAGIAGYPANLQADWQFRAAMTPAGHEVYLAITPISIQRDRLAPYRGETPDTPLAELGEPWVSAGFDDEIVKQAFLVHAINAVEFFRPDYFAIGIEVNLLRELAPQLWPAYLELHRDTYQALKQRYPSLPVFVTMTANELLEGATGADPQGQAEALADTRAFTDILGVSWYPFLSAFGTDPLPDDVYARIDALTDKTIAISETGFPAQFQQLDIEGGPMIELAGSAQKQEQFLARLLAEARARDFRFVIQFVPRDYDALCDTIDCSDFNRLWQDTGLWDESDAERPALARWRDFLDRPLAY